MLLSEILQHLEEKAPFALQENYDNSGLIIGLADQEIHSALVCLDITEDIIMEAIDRKCNLVISHHPMIFSGMKRITGRNATERLVATALKENIAIVAMHTNLDNHPDGVNSLLCGKLGILNTRILRPMEGQLRKLVTFSPKSHSNTVQSAIFSAGAGQIGNYDSCSFSVSGNGSFRALPGSHPFVGKQDELHIEEEDRIEVIYPVYYEKRIISALLTAHPYEEVAYDIYPLSNRFPGAGAGMIGELASPMDPSEYLAIVKDTLLSGCIRHTALPVKKISKIAVCGGSGSFLIGDALAAGADLYITGDIKYHDFFIPENRMILADVGHYESEQFTKELIFTLLKKKFPTFALLNSETPTNPVNYL